MEDSEGNQILCFSVGEVITDVSELPGGGWWSGTLNGKRGIVWFIVFPSDYVRPVSVQHSRPR